jgi:hypothetical protein
MSNPQNVCGVGGDTTAPAPRANFCASELKASELEYLNTPNYGLLKN